MLIVLFLYHAQELEVPKPPTLVLCSQMFTSLAAFTIDHPAGRKGSDSKPSTSGKGRAVPTVTTVVAWAVHPLDAAPVIVYVVVTEGLAVTDAPVVALSPVAGLHVYETAPLAVMETEPAGQMVADAGEDKTIGEGSTVMVMVPVPEHPLFVPVTV